MIILDNLYAAMSKTAKRKDALTMRGAVHVCPGTYSIPSCLYDTHWNRVKITFNKGVFSSTYFVKSGKGDKFYLAITHIQSDYLSIIISNLSKSRRLLHVLSAFSHKILLHFIVRMAHAQVVLRG